MAKHDGTELREKMLDGVSGASMVVKHTGPTCDEVDMRQVILCGPDCSAWERSGYAYEVVAD